HDLRDHVAGTAHDNAVADAHAQALDLIRVVQRGIADGDTADEHRLQSRHWRYRAGAADLKLDIEHARQLFLCGVFVRHRPARFARTKTELPLLTKAVDLVHHPVDIERQRIAARGDFTVIIDKPFRPDGNSAQIEYRKAELRQPVEQLAVRLADVETRYFSDAISVKRQRTLRGDTRIELTQKTRRRIARIDEHLGIGSTLLLVEALEIGTLHQHLAAHLEHIGTGCNAQWNRANGAHIGRDIFTNLAVAACRRLHQHAFLVTQIDGEAVELYLGGIRHRCRVRRQVELAPNTCIEHRHRTFIGIGLGENRQH